MQKWNHFSRCSRPKLGEGLNKTVHSIQFAPKHTINRQLIILKKIKWMSVWVCLSNLDGGLCNHRHLYKSFHRRWFIGSGVDGSCFCEEYRIIWDLPRRRLRCVVFRNPRHAIMWRGEATTGVSATAARCTWFLSFESSITHLTSIPKLGSSYGGRK